MITVHSSRRPGKLSTSKVAAFATATLFAVGTIFAVPAVATAQTTGAAPDESVTTVVPADFDVVALPEIGVLPFATSPTTDAPVESEPVVVPELDVAPSASPTTTDAPAASPTTTDAPAESDALVAPESDVAPLATPSTTDIVVSARIAYQRAPIDNTDDPAYLEGVTFELFTTVNGAPAAATGYTCEIPAGALDCTISVPDTAPGGENYKDRFSVVMTSAGDSATPITELMTGTSSEPDTLRYYPGVTSPAVGGETLAFPEPAAGQLTNSLVTAAALDNPEFEPSCLTGDRLSLATQMDLSGSVDETQRNQYRDAFQGLVLSLAGESVDLSIATFGSSSPVAGRAGGSWALDSDAGVEAALAAVENYTESVPGSTQMTNWDLALRHVANYPQTFDALLVLTDGAPNFVSNDAGTDGQAVSGSEVTLASIEQAVFSANAVKAEGTRVIAMGIGNGVAGPVSRNLAAISGPVAGSDYYQGAWETLSEDLLSVVSPLVCISPVTATTFVTDAAGENPVATDGFSVSAEASDVSTGTAVVNGDSPQVTGTDGNLTGEAVWSVSFSDADATATLTVSQAEQDGLELVRSNYTVHHADGTTATGTGGSDPLVITGLERSDRVEVSFFNKPAVTPPTPTPTPTETAPVIPTPTPTETAPVVPTPSSTPSPGTLPTTGSEVSAWPFIGGAAALLIGAAVLTMSRRRTARS